MDKRLEGFTSEELGWVIRDKLQVPRRTPSRFKGCLPDFTVEELQHEIESRLWVASNCYRYFWKEHRNLISYFAFYICAANYVSSLIYLFFMGIFWGDAHIRVMAIILTFTTLLGFFLIFCAARRNEQIEKEFCSVHPKEARELRLL